MIDGARAGIEGNVDLVLFEKLRQVRRFCGVDLMDNEAAFLRAFMEHVRKRRVDVPKDDALETITPVELHPDDGAHTPDSDDHGVCHKQFPSLPVHCRTRLMRLAALL